MSRLAKTSFASLGRSIRRENYADRVLALVPEAEALLAEPLPTLRAMAAESSTDLGAVVIDPGHGGTQNMPGSSANNAISASGVKEKKLTLDFCLILRDELLKQAAKANEQIKIVLTRTTDINLPGRERAAKAFEHKAKLFLCLHFNGSDKPAVRGTETFYRAAENGNLNLAADIAFATDIQNALFETMAALDPGAKDRGTKPDTKTGPGALGTIKLWATIGEKICASRPISRPSSSPTVPSTASSSRETT
jgi:N-acetylmuramoyl-L-alanine amidase